VSIVRLVLFDCDGTLIDSQHVIHTAMSRAFQLQGFAPPSREKVRGVVGLSLDAAISGLSPELDPDSVALVERDYKASFFALREEPDHLSREPLFEGMADLVRDLESQGIVLGVATGKAMRGLKQTLAMHGLEQHFTTLQTPDNAPGKPHPGMVLQAMAEVGAEPERTVVIGDTTFDIDMAVAAGVAGLGVAWGYHPNTALEASGARAIADDVAHLESLIALELGL
jgi:phosphoglycolate phosphatase